MWLDYFFFLCVLDVCDVYVFVVRARSRSSLVWPLLVFRAGGEDSGMETKTIASLILSLEGGWFGQFEGVGVAAR